ncbi:MAG: 2,3-bisphosphoglycerate-independent phosphoglycerate mutase [Deltaproteobacteria bacterium]|nr:2,3-bisphosphoglycerate-independent phosphoglycerate mutase [Deltaproteobacteria bacterium]
MKKPVALIIRDGWGLNENKENNAVLTARTPNMDAYKKTYPWTILECSGEAVGLPPGYQGSSEVGHLNMGAGRIVVQELKRINDELESGLLFQAEMWRRLISNWRKNNSRFHLLGLLQDEGVHAHQKHLFKIMAKAREAFPEGEIIIHPFLDGRDTPPRSTLGFLKTLGTEMEKVGLCRIGTVMGRYYGMDRSQDWKLTDQAYHCLVCAEGLRTEDAQSAVQKAYEEMKTPDGDEMTDEYVPPFCIGNYDGIHDGDSILHTNYRQDRAIQLSRAFVDPDYPGDLKVRPKVVYAGFTRYYDDFNAYLMAPMDKGGGMNHLLGEVISDAGLTQLRIAETQKFRHVTSFFNGKKTTPYRGEEQVEVPSRFDASSFAHHPEMDAYTVTDEILKRLNNNPYDFIVVNYANGDMVGHTGFMDAAVKAIEVVDECVGRIVKRFLELEADVLITSDHGNSEEMVDYETGLTKTSHTLFPVDLIYVSQSAVGKKLRPKGKLSDVAPTVLYLLGLPIPKEMTAENLIL